MLEAARGVWARLIRGRKHAGIAVTEHDLALFGSFTWGVRGEIAVLRRCIDLARKGSRAFREAAEAFAADEQRRGISRATIVRRWSTLVAVARAIDPLWSKQPKLELGAAPVAPPRHLGMVGRRELVRKLNARGLVRDAAIVWIVVHTDLSPDAIVTMRVQDLCALVSSRGNADVRVCVQALVRDRPMHALAFDGRRRGQPLDRKSIARVCERHGTSIAALRSEDG